MSKTTRQKHELDASTMSAGRLASQVAVFLLGKHKPDFNPRLDQGDAVVVTNIDKLKFTGNKLLNKSYYRFTGYVGNLKAVELKELVATRPAWIFKKIVRDMLPANKHRPVRLKRLTFK
jgi:large subunit ribosomal protein L13